MWLKWCNQIVLNPGHVHLISEEEMIGELKESIKAFPSLFHKNLIRRVTNVTIANWPDPGSAHKNDCFFFWTIAGSQWRRAQILSRWLVGANGHGDLL